MSEEFSPKKGILSKRTVQVMRDGIWEKIRFSDLKRGDVFRLWEDSKMTVPVLDEESKSPVFVGESDAYAGENSLMTIQCRPHLGAISDWR